jgi:UDP-N-acetylmuramyl pentapeptide synthase
MPTTPKKAPFVVSLDAKAPEWEVVEAIRSKFVTTVIDTETKKPKINKEGQEQVRRVSGSEVVERLVTTLLLNASEETLSALASEAQDKPGTTGSKPKFSTKDFIESIIASRSKGDCR